jgi:hypothetical protein
MRFLNFKGLRPKIKQSGLGEEYAQRAHNLDLMSGRLESFGAPLAEGQMYATDGSVFTGTARRIYKCGDIFIAWSEFVEVAPDPQGGAGKDQFLYVQGGRLYWQSAQRVVDKRAPVAVGTCAPETAPAATALVGMGCREPALPMQCVTSTNLQTSCISGDAPEQRAYVYTYIRDYPDCYGRYEESAPSEPVDIDINNGDAVILSTGGVLPKGITRVRWYRGIAGSKDTVWLEVGESATTSFADALCVGELGLPLITEGHYPPPDCLEGVGVVGDNITVVWSGRQMWCSKPLMPYAFDTDRDVYDLPYDIVGVRGTPSRTEQARTYELHILTKGTPFIATATTIDKIDIRQEVGETGRMAWHPCASRTSICDLGGATGYASPYGFVAYSGSGVVNLTDNFFSEREWGHMHPESMNAAAWHERLWIGREDGEGLVVTLASEGGTRDKDVVTHGVPISAWCAAPEIPLMLASPKDAKLYKWGRGAPMRWEWQSGETLQSAMWRPSTVKVVSDLRRKYQDAQEPWVAFSTWVSQHPGHDTSEFFAQRADLAHFAQDFVNMQGHSVELTCETQPVDKLWVRSSRPVKVKRVTKGVEWAILVSGYLPVREVHLQNSEMDLAQEGGMA